MHALFILYNITWSVKCTWCGQVANLIGQTVSDYYTYVACHTQINNGWTAVFKVVVLWEINTYNIYVCKPSISVSCYMFIMDAWKICMQGC